MNENIYVEIAKISNNFYSEMDKMWDVKISVQNEQELLDYLYFLVDLILSIPNSPSNIHIDTEETPIKQKSLRYLSQLKSRISANFPRSIYNINLIDYGWYIFVNKLYSRVIYELWNAMTKEGDPFDILISEIISVQSEEVVKSQKRLQLLFHTFLIDLIEELSKYFSTFTQFVE